MGADFVAAAGAKLGPHYFRIVSTGGASNAALFRVGGLPHRDEREPNSSVDQAEPIALPSTINGRLAVDDDFDFFRFHAERGETLIFDLRAARNGSGLDAALILLDSWGRKLEHEEDTFIWDPFFAHRFAEAGDYLAVVQPTHTRNDPGFGYQLDIHRHAHLETMSPINLAPGSETQVTIFGQGLVNLGTAVRFESAGLFCELIAVTGTSATARVKIPATAFPAFKDWPSAAPIGRLSRHFYVCAGSAWSSRCDR